MPLVPIDGPQADDADHRHRITISDETFAPRHFASDDPVLTGAQIAEAVGAHPVTAFRVLQLLPSGEVESLRPTETVDLREPGSERFFVIRGDRTFDFTIDGLELEWPLSPIPGRHLRILARARDDQDLVRVTSEGYKPVGDDDPISFGGTDVDEFRLIAKTSTVTVFYRKDAYHLARRGWSTEDLVERFSVPPGHRLDLIEPGKSIIELQPGQIIELVEGMRFTSHPATGHSS